MKRSHSRSRLMPRCLTVCPFFQVLRPTLQPYPLRRDTKLPVPSILQKDRVTKVVYFTWLGPFEVIVHIVELQTREATQSRANKSETASWKLRKFPGPSRRHQVLPASRHSGHWGIFPFGKCWEYVLIRSNIPRIFQPGKLLDYLLDILNFQRIFP